MNDEQRKAAEAIFGKEFTDGLVAQGTQKTKELEDAGIANKQATPPETPEESKEEKGVDPTQFMQELAVKMMVNINEALTPVLEEFQKQIVTLREEVVALSADLKTLKTDQAIKEKVELPRFAFGMIDAARASQSSRTEVPEGDALKNQRPQEVAAGSLTQAYFPNRK